MGYGVSDRRLLSSYVVSQRQLSSCPDRVPEVVVREVEAGLIYLRSKRGDSDWETRV